MKTELRALPVVTLKGIRNTAENGGPERYVASIMDRNGRWLLVLEQLCKGKRGPAGQWSLAMLLGVGPFTYNAKPLEVRDRLAIDDGQGWYVENLRDLLAEAVMLFLALES